MSTGAVAFVGVRAAIIGGLVHNLIFDIIIHDHEINPIR